MVLAVLTGWLDRQERQVIAYLMEENRVLRRQLGQQRIQFTDADRRRLAGRGYQLGRQVLLQIATIVTPDTILRWHRQLIVRKWTYPNKRVGRQSVLAEIRRLVVRMAEENPTWGYTRIQGALKNVGHRVGRSTIARILKAHGVSPVPARPTSWQTFLRAHWGAIAGVDFFTTEVSTWRGLVILPGVRHRPRITAGPDCRVDAVSKRLVHAPSQSHADRNRWPAERPSRADLRS